MHPGLGAIVRTEIAVAEASFLQGVLFRLERLRSNRRLSWWIYVAAALAFFIGFSLTVSSVDMEPGQLVWPVLLLLLMVAVPAMTSSNALEYTITARLAGRVVRFSDAIKIAVLSTAANLLPLPGGPFVRMKGLVDEGVRGKSAVVLTVLTALAWLSVSLLIAGLFGGLAMSAAVIVAAVGGGGILLVVWLLRSGLTVHASPRLTLAVVATEILATLVTTLRLWLAAQALGIPIGAGAFVLGVAPVLGAMVFVVPAGLGYASSPLRLLLRQSALILLRVSSITSLDRLAGLVFHGTVAVILALGSRRDASQEEG